MSGLDFEFEEIQEENFEENLARLARNYLHPEMDLDTSHNQSDSILEVYAEIYRTVGRQDVEKIYGEFLDHAVTNGNGVRLHKSDRELAAEIYNNGYKMMD